ncbi:MAG: DUF3793 family protein [Lachnospiraceae bacterium]|nr:DUF3793 family protein [Lachnospiraceae bacterium]
MSQGIIEMIRRINTEQIDTQLALHCAPLIVGLKTSNLFIIQRKQFRLVRKLLHSSNICYYIFYLTEKRATVFLYNRIKLQNHLAEKEIREFLSSSGYKQTSLKTVLPVFRERYQTYLQEKRNFPHEIGLLLGYPIEDVRGFVENNGKNYLYTGYWKVYEDVPAKKHLFRMYELAKETLIQLVINGVSMEEIMEAYSTTPSGKTSAPVSQSGQSARHIPDTLHKTCE